MRGDVVYRVYGIHEGREKDNFFGAYRTRDEAQTKIADLNSRTMDGRNWARQYHNQGFAIREAIVDTDFEIPPCPKPRDKYVAGCSPKPNRPGTWDSTIVEVFRRLGSPGPLERICEYERSYAMLQTFEPFRQGTKEFALISRDYTRTAVLDLDTGNVLAEETGQPGVPPGWGFCPVGFYVPDWWDVNDGSVIPGSELWNADHEWPTGDFGFVWGCIWGDDSSWKVQYLDLSQVQEGVIRREERFGNLELATFGYKCPCLSPDTNTQDRSAPPPFISVSRYEGAARVTFEVEMEFNLESGEPNEWQRLKIANFE